MAPSGLGTGAWIFSAKHDISKFGDFRQCGGVASCTKYTKKGNDLQGKRKLLTVLVTFAVHQYIALFYKK